ncbi:MAG TPA: hypothetical protein VMK84_04135 [Streptosporangiaceae bacterium]|nr:hypothetical protein [Streptosporangiaceae bacterium]
MANSFATRPWSLRMPAGSLGEWVFGFTTTAPGGTTPYTITGATWEYVARTSATDVSTPLIDITTTATIQGVLTVTATATLSQVQLTLSPVATATLTPGTYYHAFWMNPGTTGAFCWLSGQLFIDGNPQP